MCLPSFFILVSFVGLFFFKEKSKAKRLPNFDEDFTAKMVFLGFASSH